MSGYVSALWPGSPQDKGSPASSGRSSRSSSGSSRPASRRSSRSSSPGRSRSRSRSRSRRRHQRKYRRYSRSYSRSRSWSRSRRRGDRRRASPRRRPGSPRRGRSRSRSRSRRSPRGRRHYGFGRTVYPEQRGRRRARSRTRSRSRTPFRLSEKDRMELLEIAKANAAKALGTTNFELPASLRAVLVARETSRGAAVSDDGAKAEVSEELTEDGTKKLSEKSAQQRNIAFSSNNSVAKPVHKLAKAAAEEVSSGSPKIDKKKSPYGLWIPV